MKKKIVMLLVITLIVFGLISGANTTNVIADSGEAPTYMPPHPHTSN